MIVRLISPPVIGARLDDAGRIAPDDHAWRDVFDDDSAGSNDAVVPDIHAGPMNAPGEIQTPLPTLIGGRSSRRAGLA